MTESQARLDSQLKRILVDCAPAIIAVSGGVDSMTLAHIANDVLGDQVAMVHAVSPAVPDNATTRVQRYARDERWHYQQIDAGEFSDHRYLDNPANRCFFCKTNLYGAIAKYSDRQILSGTNLDDLRDWRPGLQAASEHAVRHPYIEAGIDKRTVRALASARGLDDLAELPAAPCLSSRVETGIRIASPELKFIDVVEEYIRENLTAATVRCRIRKSGIVIELDTLSFAKLTPFTKRELSETLSSLSQRHHVNGEISFAPYERGSAFLRGPR